MAFIRFPRSGEGAGAEGVDGNVGFPKTEPPRVFRSSFSDERTHRRNSGDRAHTIPSYVYGGVLFSGGPFAGPECLLARVRVTLLFRPGSDKAGY